MSKNLPGQIPFPLMLDLRLAHTYAPVCVCLIKIGCMCSLLYSLTAVGIPAFNVHVILGCLLFIDRSYYKERIFNTNAFSAFVLFAVILNHERHSHNQLAVGREEQKTPIYVCLNIMWVVVGMLALVKADSRLHVLRLFRFNPLVTACVMLVVHSFMFYESETEVLMFSRVFGFLVLSMIWIYLFHARHMRADHVYNATECFVQFSHVLFTHAAVSLASTVAVCVMFVIMHGKFTSLFQPLRGHQYESRSDASEDENEGTSSEGVGGTVSIQMDQESSGVAMNAVFTIGEQYDDEDNEQGRRPPQLKSTSSVSDDDVALLRSITAAKSLVVPAAGKTPAQSFQNFSSSPEGALSERDQEIFRHARENYSISRFT